MTERWLSTDEIAAHLGVNPDITFKSTERKNMPAHPETFHQQKRINAPHL